MPHGTASASASASAWARVDGAPAPHGRDRRCERGPRDRRGGGQPPRHPGERRIEHPWGTTDVPACPRSRARARARRSAASPCSPPWDGRRRHARPAAPLGAAARPGLPVLRSRRRGGRHRPDSRGPREPVLGHHHPGRERVLPRPARRPAAPGTAADETRQTVPAPRCPLSPRSGPHCATAQSVPPPSTSRMRFSVETGLLTRAAPNWPLHTSLPLSASRKRTVVQRWISRCRVVR